MNQNSPDPPSPVSGGLLGRPLLGTGFRIFFLLGAMAAVALVPAWLYAFDQGIEELGFFSPLEWHRHEMLFGYTAAIIAGFLLTAVPNWCGTKHRTGLPILLLALLWLSGRLALLFPGLLPWGMASGLDLAFLPAVGLAIAPDLIRARKIPNLGFLLVLAALTACNLAMHMGALEVWANHSYRAIQVGLDLVVLLIFVIGGRVIPFFTRRKLGVEIQERPAVWIAAHTAIVGVILTEAFGASGNLVAAACLLTALLTGRRLASWQFRGVWSTPLLWILHLGYGWVILGLLAKALAAVDPAIPSRLSAHFFTVGGIGTLTLGMMSRVALGHTGRPIEASRTMTVAFLAMTLAAGIRALVPVFQARWYLEALSASGALWTFAFLLYLWVYVPILIAPRPDGKAS